MDDTFVQLFLDYLKNRHPNIKFTIKIESERTLPYFGYVSERINHNIDKILKKNFPHLNLRMCFVNSFQVEWFFNQKDRLDIGMCSSIIYLFKCMECNSKYVGSSIRQLNCRVVQHMNISVTSRLPLSNLNHSATNINKINKSDLRMLESLYT